MSSSPLTPPVISIVVPAYNAERFLAGTVRSAQAQSETEWEMVIVNDGSTDATLGIALDLAASDRRIRVVSQANGGLPRARNAGWEATSPAAPYIIFQDADDLWLPHALATLRRALGRHPEWAGVYSLGRYVDGEGRSTAPGELEAWGRNRLSISADRRRRQAHPLSEGEPTTAAMLFVRNYILAGALLLRRADLEAAGRFDETLRSAEDWHLWVRVALRKSLGALDEPLFLYRRHDGNMSRKAKTMRRERYRAARDLSERAGLSAEQQQLFQRSQTVATHLHWMRDALGERRWSLAAEHAAYAAGNVAQYHLLPRLTRRRERP